MTKSLEKSIAFVLELEKLKGVLRKTKPLGLERYENSAEHSWQVTLLAVVMAQHSNVPIDVSRVVLMLLVHDIAEIDTGDTIVYSESPQDHGESEAAAERIFGILPPGIKYQLLSAWHEFEAHETAESKFAQAMDRAMPVLQNLNNNGQSWKENNISQDKVLAKNAKIGEGSEALWKFIRSQVELAAESGILKD